MAKTKILFMAMATMAFTSCESSQDEILNTLTSSIEQQETLTRSILEDSTSNTLTPLVATPEQLEMLNRSKRMNAPFIPSSEYDEDYFSSNIYAIRELPVSINVKRVAGGANSSHTDWCCSGAGQEVTLATPTHRTAQRTSRTTTQINTANDFYIKVLPPSSGMQYLIYSCKSNTPITIGHYDKTPNTKILMSQKDNSSYSDFVGWNLIPSTRYKGYFGIQNNLYFGQADPNNMWSVFNYTIEAIQNDKLGFAKPDANKEQQNFFITPYQSFKLVSIKYDIDNAQIYEQIEDYDGTGQNLSSQNKEVDIQFNFNALESSYYNTNNNTLKINVKDTIIACPRVSGRSIMLPTPENSKLHNQVPFESPSIHQTSKPISYTLKLNCPARKNVKVKVHFIKYNISTKFIAKAQLTDKNNNVREVKITGTWSALLYENPKQIKPLYDDPEFTSIGDPDNPIIIAKSKPIITDSIPQVRL